MTDKTQKNVQPTAPAATAEAQPQAADKPAEDPKAKTKKGKKGLWIALGCGGCFVCVLTAVIVTGVDWGKPLYNAITKVTEDTNVLCTIEDASDMRSAYRDFMTGDYQDNNSYADFKDMIEENEAVFEDCSLIVPAFTGMTSMEMESDSEKSSLSFTKDVGGKEVDIELYIYSDDGDIKINQLTVSD